MEARVRIPLGLLSYRSIDEAFDEQVWVGSMRGTPWRMDDDAPPPNYNAPNWLVWAGLAGLVVIVGLVAWNILT